MPTSFDLAQLRRDYGNRPLLESDVNSDPLVQFRGWLAEAVEHQLMEPNGMTLSTVDATGQPWSRTVLLKGCDERGFVFFTNYESDKGRQLAHEPRCALTLWWAPLERQVNITGRVEKVPRTETDAYFAQRPVASRIGAWASQQSAILKNRDELVAAFAAAQARFGENPPTPEHWGGFVVRPVTIEFWQGHAGRLHDRLRYTRENNVWVLQRLSP